MPTTLDATFDNIKNNSSFHIYEMGDIEYGNPIEYWGEHFISREISQMNNLMKWDLTQNDVSKSTKERVITKKAIQFWETHYKKILESPINRNLVTLLSTNKKKHQIRLLKGLILTSDDLMPLFFHAYHNLGYTFSNYTFRRLKGVSFSQLPKFAYIEDNGELTTIGKTSLKKEQIRQAIKSQHRLIVRFLDNGDKWHCFFQTMKGISGNEKGSQSHIHYISDSFQISRTEVLNQFKSEKYNLPTLPHIDFKRLL